MTGATVPTYTTVGHSPVRPAFNGLANTGPTVPPRTPPATSARAGAAKAGSPWRSRTVALPSLLLAIGCVGIYVCWDGASQEVAFRHQVDWLVWSAVATAAAIAAVAWWLTASLREVRMAQRAVFERLLILHEGNTLPRGTLERPVEAAQVDVFVHCPGSTLIHRPTCLYARGKTARPVSGREAREQGLGTCGACCAE